MIDDRFAAVVSNELRTPVTSLRASLALLDGGVAGEMSPDAREVVDLARRSADRLFAVVEDVVAYQEFLNDRSELVRAPASAREILCAAHDAVAALADEHGVRIELDIPDGVVVDADAPRVELAVRAMLRNAVQLAPAGSAVQMRAWAEGQELRVELHNGESNSPYDRNQLGVAVCGLIVDAHRGHMVIESAGPGARIQIAIPGASDGAVR
jgi:signal transduction histidine kinase